jgi:hypothetical protein
MVDFRRGQDIRKFIGVQHRNDDVSRVPPPYTSQQVVPITTPQGPLIAGAGDPEVYFALNLCYRVLAYRNLIGTSPQDLDWDDVSVAVEVINDSNNNVCIAFGGAIASAPAYSTLLTANNSLGPKEVRYFPIHVRNASIVADTASTGVRVTVFLPS